MRHVFIFIIFLFSFLIVCFNKHSTLSSTFSIDNSFYIFVLRFFYFSFIIIFGFLFILFLMFLLATIEEVAIFHILIELYISFNHFLAFFDVHIVYTYTYTLPCITRTNVHSSHAHMHTSISFFLCREPPLSIVYTAFYCKN